MMGDLDRYIAKREKTSPGFNKRVEQELENIRIGEKIKELRIAEGMTQEELAQRLHTTKSVISRMENHADSMRLSTLEKIADIFGKKLTVSFM